MALCLDTRPQPQATKPLVQLLPLPPHPSRTPRLATVFSPLPIPRAQPRPPSTTR